MKFTEILEENKKLGEGISSENVFEIVLLGNIIVAPIREILEYELRRHEIPAKVILGDYDSLAENSESLASHKATIIFHEACNLMEGFQYRAELLTIDELQAFEERVKGEMDLTLKNLSESPMVLWNRYSLNAFIQTPIQSPVLEGFCQRLNRYLESKSLTNVFLIDIEKILLQIGFTTALDFRLFYSSKSLYTLEFLKHYVNMVTPLFLSHYGKGAKVIVFDCDNTLWGGILSEVGFDAIEMDANKKGVFFREVQSAALKLKQNGILLCLCTKNNPEDIKEVLEKHPDMLLRTNDFSAIETGWGEKVQALSRISDRLNISLDQFLFVDDSLFELERIRQIFPKMRTLLVPEKRYEYPSAFRKAVKYFFQLSITREDGMRTQMVQVEAKRHADKSRFTNLDDYLASLRLKMSIRIDDVSQS